MVAHIFISGFVQGVGFRAFVKRNALKMGITGWVKNLQDNRVEALFCGSKETIGKMIELCNKGYFLSEVKNVEVFWEKALQEDKFKSFEVIK